MRCKALNKYYLFGSLLLIYLTALPDMLRGQRSNPYRVDFETGTTHPAIKSYAATDTIWADSIPWRMPGVYLGGMTNNDFRNGMHAARLRLTNNSTGVPAYMEMLADMPYGIQSVTFSTAMYGAETGGALSVSYSVDSGQSWMVVGDTIPVAASYHAPMKVSVEPAIDRPARIRIDKINTDNSRINIDDIAISRWGTGHYILITDKEPAGADVSTQRDSLKICFDHPVSPGKGQLSLYASGGGVQHVAIPSAQVEVRDSVALITGISLRAATRYHVLLSDSAFADTLNLLYSKALTDTGFWHFTTEDTVLPPDIPPLTGLAESFMACNEAQNLMGLFRVANIRGGQTWQCTSEGHEDSFAVTISGGFGKGVSEENEDWLVSRLPFGLSGMAKPVLSFWQKALYEGEAVRSVKVSTDYPGDGSAIADTVHWVTLNIPGINRQPGREWALVDGIDLTPFKKQPFYLAFTYACDTGGAYKLFYDDINIREPSGIAAYQQPQPLSVKVLGVSESQELHVEVNTKDAGHFSMVIYDMQGRRRKALLMKLPEGSSRHTLFLPEWASGLYTLYLAGLRATARARFLIP